MEFSQSQVTAFRKRMLNNFDSDSLELFVQDHLDINLHTLIDAKGAFEFVCNRFLVWARQQGRLQSFLAAVVAHHENDDLRQFAATMLVPPVPAVGADLGPGRPFLFAKRVLLDRSTFWSRLRKVAEGKEDSRVLVVSGGVGKTYSRWPMACSCPPGISLVSIDVAAGNNVQLDARRLANLIHKRLWPSAGSLTVDEYAQDARQGADLAQALIRGLASLDKGTWLILDQLNAVNLDPSAGDFLSRICEAVDSRECPELRLFFFGLDRTKLSSQVRNRLSVDIVGRPNPLEIREYIEWVVGCTRRTLDATALAEMVARLDALLTDTPTHAHWEAFHEELERLGCGITDGTIA